MGVVFDNYPFRRHPRLDPRTTFPTRGTVRWVAGSSSAMTIEGVENYGATATQGLALPPAAEGREAPVGTRCTVPVEPPDVIPAQAGIQFGLGTTCERKLGSPPARG